MSGPVGEVDPRPNPGGARFEVRDLTVRHGGVLAVDGVSLAAEPGQVTGVIGPNGAGKTSLLDAASGFSPPAAGVVEIGGRPTTGMGPHQLARLGLARTFQTLELFEDLSVAENLMVSATRHRRWWSILGDAVAPRRAAATVADAVAIVLERLDLAPVADRRPDELPNGDRHLVALARALVGGPSVVLLDEPAAGLDPHETAQLASTITAVAATGVTVVLVDHDMGLVLGVCDRVHVLDAGRLLSSGTPAQVRSDPTVVEAYLGVPDPS